MKKIFILLLITASCSSIPHMASATATAQPTTCTVYSIRSWFNLGWLLDGSFSQLPASDVRGDVSATIIKAICAYL